MSHLLSIARLRRSIREYDPRPIEDWKLNTILEAARLAPSSTNSQPWRLVVVKNQASRYMLSMATPGGIARHPWLKDAPVVIILCASPSTVQRVVQVIGKDYHLVDMGIVGEHIVLAAADLGIGSCWIGWIDKKKIRATFNIPVFWEIVCLISLGYPKQQEGDQEPFTHLRQRFEWLESPQLEGERGMAGIEARSRQPLDKIVFYETVGV